MTTTAATSPRESWPIGGRSSPETSTSSSAAVIFREFSAPRSLPLPNTIPLGEILARFEADPEMSGAMSQARQNLAAQLYADEPETLSALRLAAGLSQAQLAALAETSQPHIARIERGQTDPSTETVARIARALNTDEAKAFRAIRLQFQSRALKA